MPDELFFRFDIPLRWPIRFGDFRPDSEDKAIVIPEAADRVTLLIWAPREPGFTQHQTLTHAGGHKRLRVMASVADAGPRIDAGLGTPIYPGSNDGPEHPEQHEAAGLLRSVLDVAERKVAALSSFVREELGQRPPGRVVAMRGSRLKEAHPQWRRGNDNWAEVHYAEEKLIEARHYGSGTLIDEAAWGRLAEHLRSGRRTDSALHWAARAEDSCQEGQYVDAILEAAIALEFECRRTINWFLKRRVGTEMGGKDFSLRHALRYWLPLAHPDIPEWQLEGPQAVVTRRNEILHSARRRADPDGDRAAVEHCCSLVRELRRRRLEPPIHAEATEER